MQVPFRVDGRVERRLDQHGSLIGGGHGEGTGNLVTERRAKEKATVLELRAASVLRRAGQGDDCSHAFAAEAGGCAAGARPENTHKLQKH